MIRTYFIRGKKISAVPFQLLSDELVLTVWVETARHARRCATATPPSGRESARSRRDAVHAFTVTDSTRHRGEQPA
jgi:hypothetical protein